MTTSAYITGRKQYQRPQAMLWSENAGVLENGFYVPLGYEVGSSVPESATSDEIDQFIILSDDNRQSLDFSMNRIETKERMINGRMRSYHIADKLNLNIGWNMLPSRSFNKSPLFDANGKPTALSATTTTQENIDNDAELETVTHNIPYSGSQYKADQQYTSDGGAGGVEILNWYENHKGSFWVYLAYDRYDNIGTGEKYTSLSKYNQVVEMFISDFSYSVQKRGGSNYDFWNISVKLEEV